MIGGAVIGSQGEGGFDQERGFQTAGVEMPEVSLTEPMAQNNAFPPFPIRNAVSTRPDLRSDRPTVVAWQDFK